MDFKQMSLSAETVKQALGRVVDADSNRDVISSGMVSAITVQDGKVGFVLTVDARDKERKAPLREACERAVSNLAGVRSVTAVMTAHNEMPAASPEAKKPAVWNKTPIDHVAKIIAVASGKGGVGKSTTAVNLAHALARLGKRTGLLDADIYGPSIPRMMALSGQPRIEEGKMVPLANHGIACMSMGFITGDEAAILRGPMITKALHQMLRLTRWGTPQEPLDVLLVDMPPGTGDIHLSMAQQVPLSGAIIVTTPQEVALADARKCAVMFEKVGVPVFGVVENMSGGLFGSGGGKKLADECRVELLGTIGLDAAICQASDSGLLYLPQPYIDIARRLP